MHPNPVFREWSSVEARRFVVERGFGLLTLAGPDGPLAAHVPFILSEDGDRAEFHLARGNAAARALAEGDRPALIVVSGPDAYVSPDWYEIGPDQVPTWNYIAVELRGAARLRPADALAPHLKRLSAHFEARLAPKPPWTLEKTSAGFIDKLTRGILPAEMDVRDIVSTVKLNQNKPEAARAGASAGIAAAPIGSSAASDIARMMKGEQEG